MSFINGVWGTTPFEKYPAGCLICTTLEEDGKMSVEQTFLSEPSRVDEPQAAQEYSAMLSRVAVEHKPVIIRRSGEDLAAVVPLEHLELLQDALAQQEAARIAAKIDWDRLTRNHPPAQEWFDGEESKPF